MLNITEEEIKNYFIYLNFIQEKLDKYFESQKPFIFCKKGCGMCCKNQQFPYSQIEVHGLAFGAAQLPVDIRLEIEKNIDKIISDKKKSRSKKFKYDCPFLINNVCSVYDYRGLICRSFGLMIRPEEGGKVSVPFCYRKGLNYSNILNIKKKQFSIKKYKQLKTDASPNIYQVGYNQLADNDLANGFKFRLGDKKPMIDWFEIFKKV